MFTETTKTDILDMAISGDAGPDDSSSEKGDKRKEKKEKRASEKSSYLRQYCVSITDKAKRGECDAVVGRERETERVIQILCRRQKHNPCLIGEPGVGKTAVAEALAQRIIEGKVPERLKDKKLYLLDMAGLVAGTQFRGQFEDRIKNLINEIKKKGDVILLIDEIHSMVGAGDADGSLDAATIFKPALARGEIQIIGTTTLKDYRKYIEKDSALERRFQPVMIEEPSVEDAIEIIKGIRGYYETYHGVKLTDRVLERAVELSERYITDRFLPDKAIDLIDEASAHVSIRNPIMAKKGELSYSLNKLLSERKKYEDILAAQENKNEVYIARIEAIDQRTGALQKKLEEYCARTENIEVGEDDLAEVIEIWTGIPARSISKTEFERLRGLEGRLSGRIIGQDEAVSAVTRSIKRGRARIASKRKPVSFIFAGPTGVGKTELVKQLAADLFDTPDALIRVDMSEYMEKFAVSRLIGAPPGYVGHDESGQLTEKVRRRPYSVLLFDEIEKAHPDVLNVLLQILDDGRITDATGITVNFENTIIIMTTNAGSSDKVAASVGFFGSSGENSAAKTRKALEGFLRPEFLNRIDEIIVFNSLTVENFEQIAKLMLSDLGLTLAEQSIVLEYTDAAVKCIAKESYSYEFGARNMRRYIQRHVEDELAEMIISGGDRTFTRVLVDAEDGKLKISGT